MKLAGAVALVTGASSGIGAETARELARRGARVILAARRADLLAEQVATITAAGGQAKAIAADIADSASIAQLAQSAVAAWGQVDILVNNAGIGDGRDFAAIPPNDIARMLDVNLVGPMLLTRLLLPEMLSRRSGVIICVASVSGQIATAPMYSATKFGLRGFALSLRRELLKSGVSVSIVSPGFIRTPLTARRRAKMPGPEIVATAIAGLIERPRREVVTPIRYHAAILVERAAPGLMDRALGH